MRSLRWLVWLWLLVLPGSALLVPMNVTPPEPVLLTGLVRDDKGPVAGARVRIKGESNSVETDGDGRFRLASAAAASARLTAWKAGYLIAGAPADRSPLVLTLKRLPADDCERYAWVNPAPDPAGQHNCGNCHGDIYREWKASGHARSLRNRRFLNLHDGTDWSGRPGVGWSLSAENPDGVGVCTACHGPTVPFGDPAYSQPRRARGTASHGVHCDYCHKVTHVDNDQIGLTHGRFGLKLLRPPEGQLFFGPLDDVDRDEDSFSPIYRESRYCASCHEGVVIGVHVYGTYSEWLESPARREGKQCQTCHMAATGALTNIAPGKGGIQRDPRTLSNHRFFAGNQEEMLRGCLRVSVVLTRTGDGVRAEVEVRADGAGHRVPTGFIDRNIVLVVEGQERGGKALTARDGPVLPEAAGDHFVGLPGKLYAKLLKDPDGRGPIPFWRPHSEPEDTRLVAGRPDRTTFAFPAEVSQVRVRLLHRRFWPAVVQSKGWPDDMITVVDQVVRLDADRQKRWTGP
jgi:hypothetical protein